MDGSYYLVEVSEKGGAPRVVSSRPAAPAPAPKPAPPVAPAPTPAPVAQAEVAKPIPVATEGGQSITAPMPGMLIKYEKQVGDHVKRGETLLVLEAMKMYNNIPSPIDGVVVSTPLSAGANVSKSDVLAIIKPE